MATRIKENSAQVRLHARMVPKPELVPFLVETLHGYRILSSSVFNSSVFTQLQFVNQCLA